MIEGLPEIGWERRDGRLVRVPPAATTLAVDFPGLGRRTVAQIPWGDLASAWRSTGVPNLRTYTVLPRRAIRLLRFSRPLLPLVAWGPIRRRLQAVVRRRVTGPSSTVRGRARMHLWGLAVTPDGRTLERSLSVPEAYAFTAAAAVEAARRALAGELRAGAWTPTQAFGRALLDAIPGVQCAPVKGAFYLFADVRAVLRRKAFRDDMAFCEQLLESAGVALVPGSAFGAPGYVRISFAASLDVLLAAIARLRAFAAD